MRHQPDPPHPARPAPPGHRRSRRDRTLLALAAAALLGVGSAAAVAVHASAGEESAAPAAESVAGQTVDCPDVSLALGDVPADARREVAGGLATLDRQVADAFERLTAGRDGPGGTEPSANGQSASGKGPSASGKSASRKGPSASGKSASRKGPSASGKSASAKNGASGKGGDATGRNEAAGDQARPDETAAEGAGSAQDPVLEQLRERRDGTIRKITRSVEAAGGRAPARLAGMSGCAVRAGTGGQQDGAARARGGGDGGPVQRPGGPVPGDFVDITAVRPNAQEPPRGRDASTGTFTTRCGRNEEGHFNSDNVIAAPGVSNGAHHTHDYVGNRSTDAFSTDQSLAAAGTTCRNGDLSTYYWPVLRSLDGRKDARGGHPSGHGGGQPGGAADGNVGSVLRPARVSLTFEGSPAGKVVAMPRFLRIITGDAKAFTNGTANANASWSCEGFENRQLTDKYPLCPQGKRVVRTFRFQGCWDGARTDSGNHREHVAFAGRDGRCPAGFRAVPRLRQRIAYDVPRGAGIPKDTPYAVDSFPEQLHKPVTDHGDFINVLPDRLMRKAVRCVNEGRKC